MKDLQTQIDDLTAATHQLHDAVNKMLDSADPDALWDTRDIARFMRLSQKSVTNHVTKSQGFPRPVALPSGGSRWLAADVKAWAKRRKA